MFKKKLSILLSLSLAVLYISLLGTTSYAKTLTADEIRNFIYNSIEFRKSREPTEEEISAIESLNFSSWISASETYEGRWWIAKTASDAVVFGYYTGTSSNLSLYCPYIYNNSIYANTSYLTRKKSATNSAYTTIANFSNDNTPIAETSERFLYTDCNLYNGGAIANSSIVYPAGYSTINNIFSYGQSDYFTFLLNSNLNTITINGDSVPYIEHNTNQAFTYVLGELGLAENFYNAELFTYRWQQGNWKLQNIRTLNNIGPTTSNLIEVTIKGEWINPNTLYSLQMNPDPDSEFAPYSQPFFVKNRYTSITNGALDLDNTFSGDYYNNYNNDTNTQDVINNTNDDSQVTAILGDFFNSGDSGDSMLSSLGFDFIKRIDNPFVATIRTIFLGLLNCFLDNSDVVLDLGHHGTHMYISSADFSTNGSGDVFILVKYALEGLWIFFFCKAGYTILTHATTADINGLLNDVDVDGTWHNPMDRGDWRLM